MRTKRFIAIALILILALSLAACDSGNGDAPDGVIRENDTPEPSAVPTPEPGIYVLSAEGTVQSDIGAEGGEASQGFFMNYSFSLYACQTDAQNPPGAGGYEGVARLSAASDFADSIGGLLEGIGAPVSVDFDMASNALGRALAFVLQGDDSDAALRADCAPMFDGGRQFNIAASAGGYDSSQNYTDTGACPLPMTIEVFGDPQDLVRPALITLHLCEGELVLQFEGTLSFMPWFGSGRYFDSDAFKAKISAVLGE
ncbi:MAG: hypothetical protein FWF10_04430 [Clostridiales bacterium]|nr:hypothetical protein [Clostridiales bacterium]